MRHCGTAFFLAVFSAFTPAHAQSVEDVWEVNCRSCHGAQGQGGGAGTSTLLTKDLFDQSHDKRFFDTIKHGAAENGMAAFGETLDDAKIWSLVVHIRELQARALGKNAKGTAREGTNTTQHHAFTVQTLIEDDLHVPWSIDFLPDGRMLVTQRNGPVSIWNKGELTELTGTPTVAPNGQGGMMDVAVHPDYAKNGWIYLAYSKPLSPSNRSKSMTAIVRGKLDGTRWTKEQTIFEAKEKDFITGGLHFGSRIVFERDGEKWNLFFSIGERGRGDDAQDLSKPNGKVHRVRDDGSIPPDNPFVSSKDAYPSIYSYGHRNPQGLAFDEAGTLWDTEHGPRGGDEFNRVEKGANYAWPLYSFGINYNDSPFRTPFAPEEKFAMPADRWIPSIGACGLDVLRNGAHFPNWKGDFFAGGLSGGNVDRIRVVDGKVTERETVVLWLGRVRDVVCGPDGYVYVVLNDPDQVIRLVPDTK